jgi:hypothetical protein
MYVKNTLLWDALQIGVARLSVVLSEGLLPAVGLQTALQTDLLGNFHTHTVHLDAIKVFLLTN